MKSLLALIVACAVATVLAACGREAPKQPEVKTQVTMPAEPVKTPAANPQAPAAPAKPAEVAPNGATSQE